MPYYLLEAADCLLAIEAITPDQPAIEPDLGLLRAGGNRMAIAAKIKVVGHIDAAAVTEYSRDSFGFTFNRFISYSIQMSVV